MLALFSHLLILALVSFLVLLVIGSATLVLWIITVETFTRIVRREV